MSNLKVSDVNQNRFFSLNNKPKADEKPFGLALKEKMAANPNLQKESMTTSHGPSAPTQTPRGPDSGGYDVDVDF